jgi:hypothetical protein
MRVRDARDVYLAENGFTTAAYDSPKTKGSIFGFEIAVPNPPAHQRAIRLHDLFHVATGFGTDHGGEGEISAWQARRGLRAAGLYVTTIVIVNVLLGALFAPKRTIAVLRTPAGGVSLFSLGVEYESLLERTVGELRQLLGIPEHGLASGPRGLHAHAPEPTPSRVESARAVMPVVSHVASQRSLATVAGARGRPAPAREDPR